MAFTSGAQLRSTGSQASPPPDTHAALQGRDAGTYRSLFHRSGLNDDPEVMGPDKAATTQASPSCLSEEEDMSAQAELHWDQQVGSGSLRGCCR